MKFRLLRPLALASLIANAALVVTGAAVRLTGSGLGCPTWPRCTDASYTTTSAMGVHGVIEFSNRLIGIALGVIALACFVAALISKPRRRPLVWLSLAVLLGIPAQGVVGGITVLTHLNPWVVGLHFLLSMALVAVAYALWRRTGSGDGPARPLVPPAVRTLSLLTALAAAAVLVLGVIVTGSGPHAGDEHAKRNGLDPAQIAQAHADSVFLLIGLSLALWLTLRAVAAPRAASRAALVLVGVELAQGLIGFVQYFTGLPVLLVGAHMLGATLVWIAVLAVLWSQRTRAVAGPQPQPQPSASAGDADVPAPGDSAPDAPVTQVHAPNASAPDAPASNEGLRPGAASGQPHVPAR